MREADPTAPPPHVQPSPRGQPAIGSRRLILRRFWMPDAQDVFACITPQIARFMAWKPPASFDGYRSSCEPRAEADDRTEVRFVVRDKKTMECLGIAGVQGLDEPLPELGVWLKAAAHGHGYGTEAVRTVAAWAARSFGRAAFTYPVAAQNAPSRRIAEKLGGEVVEERAGRKYDVVVYRISTQER